jgi:hypothetical protein
MGSAIPLKALVQVSGFFAGFRHASLMGALAIPPLLAFAAYGLDGLIKLAWPQVSIIMRGADQPRTVTFGTSAILIVPLILSLNTAYDFTRMFYMVDDMTWIYKPYATANENLKAEGLQWIALPFGEYFQLEPALSLGWKLTDVAYAARWIDHDNPLPRMAISRDPIPDAEAAGYLDDIPMYRFPDRAYAYIEHGEEQTPCHATGGSGDLYVTCTTDRPGQLIVQDYSWTGWFAQRDGVSVPLIDHQWLAVDAPAGAHTYEFHYRPWDVAVGLIITIIGLTLTGWLWLRTIKRHSPSVPPDSIDTVNTH